MTILWPSLYHLNWMHADMHAFTHSYIGIQKTLPKHLCAQNFHSLETWEQSGSRKLTRNFVATLGCDWGVKKPQNSSTSSVPRLKNICWGISWSHMFIPTLGFFRTWTHLKMIKVSSFFNPISWIRRHWIPAHGLLFESSTSLHSKLTIHKQSRRYHKSVYRTCLLIGSCVFIMIVDSRNIDSSLKDGSNWSGVKTALKPGTYYIDSNGTLSLIHSLVYLNNTMQQMYNCILYMCIHGFLQYISLNMASHTRLLSALPPNKNMQPLSHMITRHLNLNHAYTDGRNPTCNVVWDWYIMRTPY